MKKKIHALTTLLYYDGPIEFIGQTLALDGYMKTVLGFYIDDVDDDRLYAVWERTDDAMSMAFSGNFTYDEIDWSELDK